MARYHFTTMPVQAATIDFVSDTKTQPSEGMRRAIAAAPVGDEQKMEDPTTSALEIRVAAMLGKEAALYLPSGTMANEIALGLSQLHTQNIICADLKPGNVLMDREGRLVISDFGLAIMVDRSIMRSVSSRSRGVGVTVRYAAPEQHDSDAFGALSPKADTWALGCIIVELVTGQPVWPGKREMEIMMTVAGKKQAPPIPDGLPDELMHKIDVIHEEFRNPTMFYCDKSVCMTAPWLGPNAHHAKDEAPPGAYA